MSRLDQVISLLTDKSRKTVAAELEAMELTPGLVNRKISYNPDFSSYTLKQLRELLSSYGLDPEGMSKKDLINELKILVGTYQTILGLAIGMGKYDAVPVLLSAGADPNGITPEGMVFTPPLFYTAFIQKDSDYYNVVDSLLEKGANINQTSLDDKGVVFYTIRSNALNYDKPFLEKRVRYLLGKGASPDGTRTNPNLQNPYITPAIAKLFLYFGANPNFKDIGGTSTLDFLTRDIRSLVEKPYEQILQECQDPLLLQKIARAYKVPVKEEQLADNAERKRVCECIRTIRDNASQIDFGDIRERRKKLIGEAYNSDTLSYSSSIYEFMSDELIFLESPRGKFIFHVSEIPILLKGKNPYTQEPLPDGFLKEVIKKYEYFPEYTVESAEELFTPYPPDRGVGDRELSAKLNEYLKTYNTYIDVDNLSNVNVGMLARIPSILEETVPGLVIDSISRRPLQEGISSQDYAKMLVRYTLGKLIPEDKVGIPQITNAIQQVINDDRIIKELIDEMGLSWDFNKNYLRYTTLNQLGAIIGVAKANEIRKILSEDADPEGYYEHLRDFFVFY